MIEIKKYLKITFILVFSCLFIVSNVKANAIIDYDFSLEKEFKPQIVEFNLGVKSTGANLENLKNENNKKMNKIIKNLKKYENLIYETSVFNISTFNNNNYKCINTLKVELSNLENLEEIINKSLKLGANEISNLEFKIKNKEKKYNSLLRETINKGQLKGEMIARELNLEVKEIKNIKIEDDKNYNMFLRTNNKKILNKEKIKLEAKVNFKLKAQKNTNNIMLVPKIRKINN